MEFPQDKFRPKRDSYAKARGGASKILYIACSQCDEPVMVYQKDGPGRLLRTYSDRIVWPPELVEAQRGMTAENIRSAGSLACSNTECGNVVGHPMVYESENRPAYRIVPGSIHAYRSPPVPEPQPEAAEQSPEPLPPAAESPTIPQ